MSGLILMVEDGIGAALDSIRKPRVWFYCPRWSWWGWRDIFPVAVDHDQFSRRTLVLGWVFAGRVGFPLWYCGDTACYEQTLRTHFTEPDWIDDE